MDLALVVGRAAAEDPVARRRPARTAATSTGRAGRPAGRRSGRRRGRSARPSACSQSRVDDRVAAGLGDLDVLDADPLAASVGEPLGRAPAVGGVLRQGRDARDPQERLVRLERARRVRVEVGLEGGVGSVGGRRGHRPMVRPTGAAGRTARGIDERAGRRPARVAGVAGGSAPAIRPAAGSAAGVGRRLARADDRRRRRGCSPSAAGR